MGGADVDSEFSERYWFGTELRSDWKVGSPFALVRWTSTTDTGEILEADPPRRLSYTFKHVTPMRQCARNRRRRSPSRSRPLGKLVKLTLTHEGFVEGSKLLDGISRDGRPSFPGSRACSEIRQGAHDSAGPRWASRDSNEH